MSPDFGEGRIVIVNKLAYGLKAVNKNFYFLRWAKPKLHDIVVYKKNGHLNLKRVAGIYGSPVEFFSGFDYNEKNAGNDDVDGNDKVDGNNAAYKMRVENKTIELDAIQFRKLGGFAQKENQGIPLGTVLLLGDNLEESYDSRHFGFVSIDSIYGKVFLWK